MKTYLNKTIKITKPITEKVTCDICGKTIADKKKRYAEYWTLITSHNDWGNDSCESYQDFDLCSKKCVQEKLNEYFDNCKNSNTQEFELSQNTIRIDIAELKGENNPDCRNCAEFNHKLFYEFLLNEINPNEMEKYRSMFLSSGEIVN